MHEYWVNVYINRKTDYAWYGVPYTIRFDPGPNLSRQLIYRIHVKMKPIYIQH